ncbi:MAG: rhodanese-like domain-containing protein [Clostridium sp.]|nr:rhodanese-like domain-containing protein [Clostridium sp.]
MFGFTDSKVIDINEIDDYIGKINLIDIREHHEFRSGSIKTAKNIPMGELLEDPDMYLEKNKEYYIMCRSGVRSARTCKELKAKGFNVHDVTSGIILYEGENRI